MPGRDDAATSQNNNRRQLQGLPVLRRNAAGIDLGSERHWVCAATLDGSGREIASFGATTPELLRLAECLKARQVVGGDGEHGSLLDCSSWLPQAPDIPNKQREQSQASRAYREQPVWAAAYDA